MNRKRLRGKTERVRRENERDSAAAQAVTPPPRDTHLADPRDTHLAVTPLLALICSSRHTSHSMTIEVIPRGVKP
ncbi:hypothetical protein CFP56_003298 [Quercus suber]|uniref:Uncharacterized protein n=1 Tax=Quercus suber TaxID=58331 RepID=A0AAW0LE47_QUESU